MGTNRLTNQSSHFRQTQLNYNPSFRYLFLYCELSFSSQSWIAAATTAVILLTRLATVLRRELQLATTAEPKDTSVANALQLRSQSPLARDCTEAGPVGGGGSGWGSAGGNGGSGW